MSRRVLLVEDDHTIRSLVRLLFEDDLQNALQTSDARALLHIDAAWYARAQ